MSTSQLELTIMCNTKSLFVAIEPIVMLNSFVCTYAKDCGAAYAQKLTWADVIFTSNFATATEETGFSRELMGIHNPTQVMGAGEAAEF